MPAHVIDTSLFDRERTREEARRARKMENIYYAGQSKIWDGRDVLKELSEKHGGIHMGRKEQAALARVFSGLMWGELAAWKVAAQLADRLECFEAKMAATSQAHDEARHFYVLHDYLEMLEVEIPPLDRATRFLLEGVLKTEDVVKKLVGMQLYVETMAITLFRMVRKLNVEPVLSDLMLFYERDEARHIGLGVQHTPELVRALGARDTASLAAFQSRLLLSSLASLKRMEPSLVTLGVSPRALADSGQELMIKVIDDLSMANGGTAVRVIAGPVVLRSFEATKELMFPLNDRRLSRRIRNAGRALVSQAA